jgi:hypothetical protein
MATSDQWIEAGLFLRGSLRKELAKAGITFTETKSLTGSVFLIPDTAQFLQVRRALQRQGLI